MTKRAATAVRSSISVIMLALAQYSSGGNIASITESLNIPPTSVVLDQNGTPIELSLPTTAHWAGYTLPATTRILLFDSQIELLVPTSKSDDPEDSRILLPGSFDAMSPYDTVDDDYASKQCYDYPPWLLINGPANQQLQAPLENRADLPATLLVVEDGPVHVGLNTLAQSLRSQDFDLSAGTLVMVDDSLNVTAIYSPFPVRYRGTTFPPRTFIDMELRNALMVIAHTSFLVDGKDVAKNTYVILDSRGHLASFATAGDLDVVSGFTIPDGSRVYISSSRIFRVDLVGNTTYRGIPVGQGTSVCFLADGTTNLLVSENVILNNQMFSKGSTLILAPGGSSVEHAFLSAAGVFGGHSLKITPNLRKVSFHSNGALYRGLLAAPELIQGIHIKEYVTLSEHGSVQEGTLEGNQTINGIPCAGDHSIQLNAAGVPLSCTIASNFTEGDTHFKYGDLYGGSHLESVEILVASQSCADKTQLCLSDLIDPIRQQLLDQLKAKLMESSSQFPFGNIGRIEPRTFTAEARDDHIDLHQAVYVENMLTNPGFSDCDVTVNIDMRVKWKVYTHFGGDQRVVIWPATIGGGYRHNFCPGTVMIQGVVSAAVALNEHVRELVEQKLENIRGSLRNVEQQGTKEVRLGLAVMNAFYQKTPTLIVKGGGFPDSVKITALFADSEGLKLRLQYIVSDSQ